MHARVLFTVAALTTLGGSAAAQTRARLNPIIELLEQKQPVFGLYAPANRRVRPGETAPPNGDSPKTPAQLAQDALGNRASDYVFDGSMEGNYDAAFPTFVEFVKGMSQGGAL